MESNWIIELSFALLAPFVLISLFTRVTYNKWVGLILALGMLIFLFRAFERDNLILIVGLASFFLGTLYAIKLERKYKSRWK